MTQMRDAVKVSSLFFVCVTLITLSITGGVGYYYTQDRQLMAKNIKDAIDRGIDPMSVRCSYAKETDVVCVAYAYSKQGKATPIPEVPISIKK